MNQGNQIFIISGDVRTGKTLLISNLLNELSKLGLKATGVYSPARFENGEKTGIYAVDISSGLKELMAIHQPGWDLANPNREWKMDPEVLKWGDKVIQYSVPTTVLIIDELGFLEFEKNTGWISAFDILEDGDYKIAIVVVRAGLLKLALAKWENARIIYIEQPSQSKERASFLIDQIQAMATK
jgi:nucleoside-triphosphatase THEP1